MILHPNTKLTRFSLRVSGLCLVIIALSCAKRDPTENGSRRAAVQVKGSDTMVNVAQAWAEEFTAVAPDIAVEVSGGGSGVGIAALQRGTIDIANASRDIKPGEADAVLKNTGKQPVEFVVGFDALAVYVNNANPLEEITLEQLSDIYSEHGKTTRWSDIGITVPGARTDRIALISRQSSSGTYEFFREHVLDNKDFKLGTRDMNGSKEVVELVGAIKTAIGYSGMGYATPRVKMLRIRTNDGSFEPTVKNTQTKAYPLARSLQLYTAGEPTGPVKRYIDWIMSPHGQKLLKENGYVPVALSAAAD